MPEEPAPSRPNVVLFDGVCVLCDGSMRWLFERDRAGELYFAPLQGETAKAVMERHPRTDGALGSVLYVRGLGGPEEAVLDRSEAALAILRDIGGVWTVASWLRVVPRFLRDAVYDFIAERRYGWFGKLEACRLPDPEMTKRFLP